MSLYIRLQNSFWEHRKTLRLRSILGDAAFWIPPRLWSYAAANQPDGDFSAYSAEEIAHAIRYTGDATSMLQALLEACFMDQGPKLHGWEEHNEYHAKFAERAKIAAAARWGKGSPTPPPKKTSTGYGKGDKHCLSNATSMISDASDSKSRQRNPLLDALVSLDGSDPVAATKPAFARAAKALQTIREVSADVTPDEIRRRARNYAMSHPTWELTCTALASHWSACDQKLINGKPAPPSIAIQNLNAACKATMRQQLEAFDQEQCNQDKEPIR